MTWTAPTVREEQARLTRDRIMRGLAGELVEAGPHEVSIQSVADRAGVSHRTVYRHFGSKDELFGAYRVWLNERLAVTPSAAAPSLAELPATLREVFRRFEAQPELVEAYVRMGSPGDELDVQSRRTEQFEALISEAAPDLDARYQRALAAVVRQVGSSVGWFRARFAIGVDGEALGEVSSWLLQLVADAVESGRVPPSWAGRPSENKEEET